MYPCPHCGEPGISFWQKWRLAPGFRPAACSRCGGLVTVSAVPFHLTSMPALLPIVAALAVARLRPDLMPKGNDFVIFAGVGLLLLLGMVQGLRVVRTWLVPLVRKGAPGRVSRPLTPAAARGNMGAGRGGAHLQARRRRAQMKHYAATVQCKWCGRRFSVCVHSPRLVASAEGFTVLCPENNSRVHVPAGALAPVQSCPAGAVVVRDNPWVAAADAVLRPIVSRRRRGRER